MKMYELYEAFFGVVGGFEIFLKNAGSGRLFLLHFASCPSYFRICEAVRRVSSLFYLYFMKIMKIYEGGIFNGFFGFGSLFPAQDMKLESGCASWKFINNPLRRLRHLPHSTLSGTGGRTPDGGGYVGGVL